MKKLGCLLFAFLFVLSACSAAPTAPDKPIADILNEIAEGAEINNPMPIGTDSLLSLYGISADDVDESACFITMNGVFPDEVIIVKAKDADGAKRIKACLDNRLKEVLDQSRSYDAESYAVAQKCHVTENGLYISLFVSAAHEKMNEIYLSHFKG